MKRSLPLAPTVSFLLLLLLGCLPLLQAQSVDLKLKLTQGEQYRYFFDNHSTIVMGHGPLEIEVGMGLTMDVTGSEGANKLLKATYNRAVTKMDMSSGKMDIDTDQPKPAFNAADPMSIVALLFHGLKGQSFLMTISETGELVNITGFEKIVDNMIDSVASGGGVPDAMKTGMRDGMSKQFNAESMKEQLQQAFNIFSKGPVKVGDSWVKKIETRGTKSMKVTNTYTVKSIAEKEVVLELQAVIESIMTEAGMAMSGRQEGILAVDPQTGMLIRSEITQALTGIGGDGMRITGKSITTRQ